MAYERPNNYNPLESPRINVDTITLGLIPPKSTVLDVGCGGGYLGKIMQQKLFCKVTGVEINSQDGKIAKKNLHHVIVGNIEDNTIIRKIKTHGPYDIIFASAVFEHLLNPNLTIQKLSNLLAKNGFFIITLPNIAHYTARLSHLRGNFQYTDSGIFDKTHLHFYTQKTSRELLEKNNLKIVDEDFEFFGPRPLSLFFKYLPNLFAYQFIYKSIPKKYDYK